MERTQVYLEETLKERLRSLAKREGRSMAALVRDAAAEYVVRSEGAPQTDPLLDLIGIGRGGPSDGALEHDHYLYGAPKTRGASSMRRAPKARR